MQEPMTPTVIVSRTPKAGREREFERWLAALAEEARSMPGHIGSEIQRPGVEHPGAWVIIFRFESNEQLQHWLDSERRGALVAEGTGLIEGPATLQRLATRAGEDPVTAVSSFRLRPGHTDGFVRDFDDVRVALETFDGYLHSELHPPVENIQEDMVVTFSFSNRAFLDAWFSSPKRERLLARLEQHLDGDRQTNVVGGYGGWFHLDEKRVTTWKQAAVVLLALYPTALALSFLLDAALPTSTPEFARIFFGNALGVAILTWLLMPRLTAALDGWLRR